MQSHDFSFLPLQTVVNLFCSRAVSEAHGMCTENWLFAFKAVHVYGVELQELVTTGTIPLKNCRDNGEEFERTQMEQLSV